MNEPILQIKNLTVQFKKEGEIFTAVQGVSFDLFRNEIFMLVGPSGTGKSAVALAILGLHNRNFTQVTGEILFEGENLLSMNEPQLNKIRGRCIGMVFQDPLSALNPLMRIGAQIEEPLAIHTNMSKLQKKSRALELLSQVKIKNAQQIYSQLPHQLSGGMRQRVMIAMALACKPEIIIADEPTTALDATVAAQTMELLQALQHETQTTIFLITHDKSIVDKYATRVEVLPCLK